MVNSRCGRHGEKNIMNIVTTTHALMKWINDKIYLTVAIFKKKLKNIIYDVTFWPQQGSLMPDSIIFVTLNLTTNDNNDDEYIMRCSVLVFKCIN